MKSTNAGAAIEEFGNKPRKNIFIPRLVDEYNFNINGVDFFDQFREVVDVHFTCRRNWFSTFIFALDIGIFQL